MIVFGKLAADIRQKEALEREIEELEREAGSIDNDYSLNLNKLHTVLHLLEDLTQDSWDYNSLVILLD